MSAAALLLSRTALRRTALAGTAGVVSLSLGGGALALRAAQRPLRMDAHATPRPFTSSGARPGQRKGPAGLDPEVIKQMSGGSVTGFISGLLVSVFSRTLVLLLGITVVIAQVAARYGIDLVDQLRVKDRVKDSRVLAALRRDPAFKFSFGLFFAMSAFMRFDSP